MDNTATTRFSLYETPLSDSAEPVFLGAEINLDRVVEEAVRLVSGLRYKKLHVSDGEQIIVRVYRNKTGAVWVATRADRDTSPQTPDQEVIPSLDWSRF